MSSALSCPYLSTDGIGHEQSGGGAVNRRLDGLGQGLIQSVSRLIKQIVSTLGIVGGNRSHHFCLWQCPIEERRGPWLVSVWVPGLGQEFLGGSVCTAWQGTSSLWGSQ
jgi:hypothetical protein